MRPPPPETERHVTAQTALDASLHQRPRTGPGYPRTRTRQPWGWMVSVGRPAATDECPCGGLEVPLLVLSRLISGNALVSAMRVASSSLRSRAVVGAAVSSMGGAHREGLLGRRGASSGVTAAGAAPGLSHHGSFTRSELSMTYLPALLVLHPVVAWLAGGREREYVEMPSYRWSEVLAITEQERLCLR